MERRISIVDESTAILWSETGLNMFVRAEGPTQDMHEEVVAFEQGSSRFTTKEELYTWALSVSVDRFPTCYTWRTK